MKTTNDILPPQKSYPAKGRYTVLCRGGFNDGNLKKLAAKEGVKLPWYHNTYQELSGALLNRMIKSGAEFENISPVIPPSTKAKLEDKPNDKKQEEKEPATTIEGVGPDGVVEATGDQTAVEAGDIVEQAIAKANDPDKEGEIVFSDSEEEKIAAAIKKLEDAAPPGLYPEAAADAQTKSSEKGNVGT